MIVLVKFPNDADKNTQAAGTVRFCGLRRKRLCWEFFLECPVVKKQATTRFQGDDLFILTRLHSIRVKKWIESRGKLLSRNFGVTKKKYGIEPHLG